MQNLTPQNYTVTISGQDVTAYLQQMQGNRSSIDESGLCITSGELILSANSLSNSIELDDRLNPLFSKGASVQCLLADNGQPIPLLGNLIVDQPFYNGNTNERIQSLKLSCKLGMANQVTNADIGVCIRPGTSMPVAQAVQELMLYAGLSLNDLDLPSLSLIPGTSYNHLQITAGSSAIRLAGQLCYENGYMLWQNRLGKVQAIPLTESGPARLTLPGSSLLTYERNGNAELPPEKIIVSGEQYFTNTAVSPNWTIWKKERSVYTEQSYSIDRASRLSKNSEWTIGFIEHWAPDLAKYWPRWAGFLQENLQVETYEQANFLPGICIPQDEGRILQRVRTDWELSAKLLMAYYQYAADFAGKQIARYIKDAGIYLYKINAKTVIETWQYNLPQYNVNRQDIPADYLGGFAQLNNTTTAFKPYSVKYTRQVLEPLGSVFPQIGDPTLGRGGSARILSNPNEQITTELLERTWTLSTDLETWSVYTVNRLCYYRRQPERIAFLIDEGQVPINEIVGIAKGLFLVPLMEPPIGPAPSYGRFPPAPRPKGQPYEFRLNFSSANPYPTSKSLSFSENTANSQLAAKLAFAWGKRQWSKYKGYKLSGDFALISDAEFEPLSRCDVFEQNNLLTSSYSAENLSVVISPQEGAVFSVAGMYLGHNKLLDKPQFGGQLELSIAQANPDEAIATLPNGEQFVIALQGNVVFGTSSVTLPNGQILPAVIADGIATVSGLQLPQGSAQPSNPPYELPLQVDCKTGFACTASFVQPIAELRANMEEAEARASAQNAEFRLYTYPNILIDGLFVQL